MRTPTSTYSNQIVHTLGVAWGYADGAGPILDEFDFNVTIDGWKWRTREMDPIHEHELNNGTVTETLFHYPWPARHVLGVGKLEWLLVRVSGLASQAIPLDQDAVARYQQLRGVQFAGVVTGSVP